MTSLKTIENNTIKATFLPTGDLFELSSGSVMINQLHGNVLDGSLNQLYLRVKQGDRLVVAPMIGSNSKSKVKLDENQATWQGHFAGVDYQVVFQLSNQAIWFWQVELSGLGHEVDVIFGQDLGNASKGAVQSNEAYMSQYVDHHITQENGNIVVSSRQNQVQGTEFPLVEHGSLSSLRSFATDGYQFFGKTYKETGIPEALYADELANDVYQYEFAYIALQTDMLILSEEKTEVVFYGTYQSDQATAVNEPVVPETEVKVAYAKLIQKTVVAETTFTKQLGQPIVGENLTNEEVTKLFPERYEIEEENGVLYSFFTANYQHVVLKEKEVAMERAHGHILLSGSELTVDQPVISSTVYMYGIFNSQIVLGNTTNHKLTSNSRNSLNTMKHSGQRIYLQNNNEWQLLTMPSAFIMGLNSATWIYKLADDIIQVRSFTASDRYTIQTEIRSLTSKTYTWAITNDLVMGPDEEHPEYKLTNIEQGVKIKSSNELVNAKYPGLVYYYHMDKQFELTDESLFVGSATCEELLIFKVTDEECVTLTTQGNFIDAEFEPVKLSFSEEETKFVAFINDLLNGFNLSHQEENEEVEAMNTLVRWYTHNMLVHYLSPHGLEQYGGAAWGTRDVSQGPTEFFFAINRPEIVGSIIEKIYENQFSDDGNWPQWFMFDRYMEQKADESHGDVIVWPLKVVADYLEKTKDFSILSKKIAYTDRNTFKRTLPEKTLLDHIKQQIGYIQANFLDETFLSSYGDGDWDDTLQPQNSALRKNMVSSWTVALTYQVLNKFAGLMNGVDPAYAVALTKLVEGIKADYKKFVLGSETIPGFIYLEDVNKPELMIHPTDKTTGIQYRLLPMTRSMIAELLTPAQVEHHLGIIKENLYFPDGVHLMNRPANYAGGVSTNFKRAEQAANFGREVGLQYVHAHIRFIEAMAKIGHSHETWKGLNTINPIGIKKHVKNAEIRQANAYFSSSDGKFSTRYEAQENFDELREGKVAVKGGWRIYSSGPGIYLNQLISNVLGLRVTAEEVVFDPILPTELTDLVMSYKLFDRNITITFNLGSSQSGVYLNGEKLSATIEGNPYRQGGYVVATDVLKDKLGEINNFQIFL